MRIRLQHLLKRTLYHVHKKGENDNGLGDETAAAGVVERTERMISNLRTTWFSSQRWLDSPTLPLTN
jgi:hypothetical protein